VDDAERVGRLERLGDLARDRQRLVERHWSAGDAHAQVAAFDQLHDDRAGGGAGTRRRVLEPIDLRDVGVIERRQRPRLAFEAHQPIAVAGERGRKDLQRHVTPELGVAGAIDLAHPAGAECRDHFVGAEPDPGGQRRVGHRAGF
jgi:hypothetical protein